jgi:hypothetical protein
MGSLPIIVIPYRAAMSGNWKSMVHHYRERASHVPFPVTFSEDTALHLAVYSKQEQPLKDLLEIVNDMEFLVPETESLVPEIQFLKRKNKFGNTALHEATICGNYEAVRLLVECCEDLLKETNNYGETPLFTAAGFAEAEIVGFLIRSKPQQCVDDKCRILSIHRKRTEDDLSILSAAIRGQHFGNNYYSLYIILNFKKYTHIYKISYNSSMPNFMNAETALMLLELDDSLHKLKDKDGVTALQLLAQMPTAFESGFPMGICGRLIYCCMPKLTTLLDLTILSTYFLSVYHGHTHTLICIYVYAHTHIN